jgi:hypothetical protein
VGRLIVAALVVGVGIPVCSGCGEKPKPEETNTAPTAANPEATRGMEAGRTIDMRMGQSKGKDGK